MNKKTKQLVNDLNYLTDKRNDLANYYELRLNKQVLYTTKSNSLMEDILDDLDNLIAFRAKQLGYVDQSFCVNPKIYQKVSHVLHQHNKTIAGYLQNVIEQVAEGTTKGKKLMKETQKNVNRSLVAFNQLLPKHLSLLVLIKNYYLVVDLVNHHGKAVTIKGQKWEINHFKYEYKDYLQRFKQHHLKVNFIEDRGED